MRIPSPGVTASFHLLIFLSFHFLAFPRSHIPGPIDVIIPVPAPLLLPGAVEEPGPAVEFVFCVPAEGVSGDGSTIGILSFPPGTEGPEGADGF